MASLPRPQTSPTLQAAGESFMGAQAPTSLQLQLWAWGQLRAEDLEAFPLILP